MMAGVTGQIANGTICCNHSTCSIACLSAKRAKVVCIGAAAWWKCIEQPSCSCSERQQKLSLLSYCLFFLLLYFLRGLYSLVTSNSNDRTWQRMRRELEKTDISSKMKFAAVTNVQRCLESFEPLKMEQYAISLPNKSRRSRKQKTPCYVTRNMLY